MDKVDEAFRLVKRADFLGDALKGLAYIDTPLPIGHGQTISQPTTVRMMLEWLAVHAGDKVLDVGSGSGWTTALLAHLVKPGGKVYAVEKILDLVMFGARNNHNAGIRNVQFFEAGKVPGVPEFAPFNRILVSASATKLPHELVDQLAMNGRLVIPIGRSIHVIDKTAVGIKDSEHPGFVFVPLL